MTLCDLGPQARHMGLHIVAMNIVAPLLAALLVARWPRRMRSRAGSGSPRSIQVVALWASHAPAVHHLAMARSGVQLATHGILLLSALAFWTLLLALPDARRWHAIPALLLTGKLVCLLAALMVFAPRTLYGAGHVHGAAALADQQLAGLLMIAACPLSYLVAAIMITVALVCRDTPQPVLRQPVRSALMRLDLPAATRRMIRLALYAAGALVLLGFLFLWSGVYTVAASRGHWAVTEWLLTFAMRNSVKTHAIGIEPPPLDQPDLVTLGAGHFHGGCAFCHGAPGVPVGPVADSMLPPPPDLATQMRPWRDRELFWIVKHGIKYTGMPAWPAQQRDDEVWAVVAFLRRLPALDADGYRALALGDLQIPPQSGRELATTETTSRRRRLRALSRRRRNAPPSALVPLLHGQPVEFLAAALARLCGRPPRQRHHAAGRRRSRRPRSAIGSRAITPGCRLRRGR